MDITTIGIDISKDVFQLHGVNRAGKAILKKTLKRDNLLIFMSNLPKCRIIMEACGSANYWARKFKEYGHEVRLISPQLVKPFVKGNKNDYKDAEAIVEADSRPSMRYVSPKTTEQQDIQSLLRIRESYIHMRTKTTNQIRGLLAEYGVAVPRGIEKLRKKLPELFSPSEQNELSDLFKQLLITQYEMILTLDMQIKAYDKQIKKIAEQRDDCQKVTQLPGIGPITAVAVAATLGNPSDFKNGRHFAAYLGLVPKQHSSGGKDRLLGISKRGNSYLRQLLIHGARAVVSKAKKKNDPKSQYLKALESRVGMNRASVALANKNARVILAILLKNEPYRADLTH